MADKEQRKVYFYLNNAGYKKVKSELIEGVSVIYIKSKDKNGRLGLPGQKYFIMENVMRWIERLLMI